MSFVVATLLSFRSPTRWLTCSLSALISAFASESSCLTASIALSYETDASLMLSAASTNSFPCSPSMPASIAAFSERTLICLFCSFICAAISAQLSTCSSSLSDVSDKLLAGAVKCLLFSTSTHVSSCCVAIAFAALSRLVRLSAAAFTHSVKLSFKADMASMLSFENSTTLFALSFSCLRDDSSSCLDFSSSSKSASISFDFAFTFSKNPLSLSNCSFIYANSSADIFALFPNTDLFSFTGYLFRI